jgi:hypothetical protein
LIKVLEEAKQDVPDRSVIQSILHQSQRINIYNDLSVFEVLSNAPMAQTTTEKDSGALWIMMDQLQSVEGVEVAA